MSLDRLTVQMNGIVIPRTALVLPSPPGPDTAPVSSPPDLHLDAFAKKLKCISALLIRFDGEVTLDMVEQEYLAHWEPTTAGDTPRDTAKRRRLLGRLLRKMLREFRPRLDTRRYPFQPGRYDQAVATLNIPYSAFAWKRRETLSAAHLADFVGVIVANAFYNEVADENFGRTSRNATVKNTRSLKSTGRLTWTLNNSTYKKYLDLAVQYGLLDIREPHEKAFLAIKGKARMISPGRVLTKERAEWDAAHAEWRQRFPVSEEPVVDWKPLTATRSPRSAVPVLEGWEGI
jgi:hypothetical protein